MKIVFDFGSDDPSQGSLERAEKPASILVLAGKRADRQGLTLDRKLTLALNANKEEA